MSDLKTILYSLYLACLLIIVSSVFFVAPEAQNEELNRLTGILGKANGTAIMARMGMMFGILIFLFQFKPKSKLLSTILLFSIGFFYYTIILTASRANFAIASLMFPFLILGTQKIKVYQKAILLALFGVFVGLIFSDVLKEFYIYDRFTDTSGSVKSLEEENRFKYFVLSLNTFFENPIIGIGLNQFRYLSGGKIAHTDIVDIATQIGIFGLISYTGMYFKLYKRIKRNLKVLSGRISSINLWLLFFLASELLFGFFGTNWFLQIHMIFFTILVSSAHIIYKYYLEKASESSIKRDKIATE
jgi:O-antigen ligase